MNCLTNIPNSENENSDQRDYGFFIRNGKYFVTEYRKGDSIIKELSNFVMEIEFHLVNGTNNTKRIIKIQRNTGEISLVEVYASDMKPDAFEIILKSKRCTFLGTAYQLKIIFARLMDRETEAVIITTLGWNQDYAAYFFADAVYCNNKLQKIDQLGIIDIGDMRFYLPAYGMVNDSNEDFETERLYTFSEGETNFSDWAALFYQAFGANGVIAIMFLFLCVYRDIVFREVKFFPFLFLFGDFGTGKTSFGERLLSVFCKDIIGTPLNNATSIALSRLVSTRSNGLFYFKEFTNETDEKVQDFILTAYDGAGRTTGIKSNDNKTKNFPIRSGLIFDGNHLPTQKTAILSRMILLNFEEKNYNDEQKSAFETLNKAADSGLGKVLLEMLSKRDLFKDNFRDAFQNNLSDLKLKYKDKFPERTLNHIALLMTPIKILCYVVRFPFDFKEVLFATIEIAENQNTLLKQSGASSIFWEAFSNCLKKGLIVRYDGYNSKAAHFNIKEYDSTTGIIQIKLLNLYPFYVRYCKENNMTFLDHGSLRMILTSKSNKEFLSSSQKGRGATYTDKNFGSCYQFSFQKTGDSISLSEIEINL